MIERYAQLRALVRGKRIDNETQLANTYGQWIGVVAAEQRAVSPSGSVSRGGAALHAVDCGLIDEI